MADESYAFRAKAVTNDAVCSGVMLLFVNMVRRCIYVWRRRQSEVWENVGCEASYLAEHMYLY